MKALIALLLITPVAACMTVRQQDLDAWRGVPVEALDTHSIFITMPMQRTMTSSGIEVRNYSNTKSRSSCFTTGNANVRLKSDNPYLVAPDATVQANSIKNCVSKTSGCNNIFYIKDGVVLEYLPTGKCYTNKSAQPQALYKDLMSR